MNNRRALLASLALNLFLVGLIAGALIMTGGHKPERGHRSGSRYWAAAEAFDPADRQAFRELLRREAAEARPRVEAMRRARAQAGEALAAANYDPAAARAALARAQAEHGLLRSDLDAAVLEFARRLDPEERAALGAAMRRSRGKRAGGPSADR